MVYILQIFEHFPCIFLCAIGKLGETSNANEYGNVNLSKFVNKQFFSYNKWVEWFLPQNVLSYGLAQDSKFPRWGNAGDKASCLQQG